MGVDFKESMRAFFSFEGSSKVVCTTAELLSSPLRLTGVNCLRIDVNVNRDRNWRMPAKLMKTRKAAEVFPPGDYIREELEARGWTQADLAKIIGRTQPAVNEMITGKRGITPESAWALAAAFGTSAEFWMNLETMYSLARAETDVRSIQRRAEKFGSRARGRKVQRFGRGPESAVRLEPVPEGD